MGYRSGHVVELNQPLTTDILRILLARAWSRRRAGVVLPLTAYASRGIFVSSWEVEYTEEFGRWWDHLEVDEPVSVDASVRLLERFGPALPWAAEIYERHLLAIRDGEDDDGQDLS